MTVASVCLPSDAPAQSLPSYLSFTYLERGVSLHGCFSKVQLLLLTLDVDGKTRRPFRYNLNQIPYDYTVELRNRFKGLDLIECLMNYGWRFMTLHRTEGSNHPQEKELKKTKIVV